MIEGKPFNTALIQEVYDQMTGSTDEDTDKFHKDLNSENNTCNSY